MMMISKEEDYLDSKKIKEIISRYKTEEETQRKVMLGRLHESKEYHHPCGSDLGSEQSRSLDKEEKT
jgi:hypothetical protein